MLDTLQKESWQPLLNQTFDCNTEAEPIRFELLEITGMGSKPGAKREPYSLVFRGPAEPVLEQGIVPLTHAQLGNIEIFLVPIGPDSQGMCYEAVFT
ncbi:MAG: hypothetical protein KDK04_20750 [Candidatus Competibacteraceae bacterium]|nr:hypothetical protein [Candidatus Competibacteraceae bacterium]